MTAIDTVNRVGLEMIKHHGILRITGSGCDMGTDH